MDQIDATILLGIAKNQSIQEIAEFVSRSPSTVYDRMCALRDNGYIHEWPEKKARVKKLTETGEQMVRAMFGDIYELGRGRNTGFENVVCRR